MLFKEIIGQNEVKNRLIQSVNEQRIAHAQLFLGAPGAGALSLAVAYAQYIVCTNRSKDDACGVCPACNKAAKLIHPDVNFVYPIALSKDVKTSTDLVTKWREAFLENPYLNLNQWFEFLDAENKQAIIPVNESAAILQKLSLTSYEGEYKIMIIWMAERMNTEAANKLLKILEEPPEKTLFMLVCENEDQLLKTITSRTQLVKIKKISDAELRSALMERFKLSSDEAMRISHLADGSYNEALQLMNQSESALFNVEKFQTLMRICFKFDAIKVVEWIDEMAAIGRERQKGFLTYALHMMRECLALNYAGMDMVKLEGPELDFVKKFAPFIHGGNVERMSEEINKAIRHIERNGAPKIIFMDLAFKLNELLNQKVNA